MAVLALSACQQRLGELAPFTQVGSAPDSVGGTVVVQKGDSAYILSRRYNVPLRDLIEVNRLTPPYVLEVGQRLTLPVSRQYVVQRGDTLYGISRMFNVDVSELTRVNNLTAPYAVHTGQPLRLPGAGDGRPGGAAVAEASTPAAGAAAAGAAAGSAVGGSVAGGSGKPAGRGSIQVTEIPAPGAASAAAQQSPPAAAPTSPAPAGVSAAPLPPVKPGGGPGSGPVAGAPAGEPEVAYLPGQAPTMLRPPGQKPSVSAEPAAPTVAAPAAAAPLPPTPLPPTPPAGRGAGAAASAPAQAQPPAQVEQVAAAPPTPPKDAAKDAAKDTDDDPPPRGGGRFLWPVKGKLLSSYGPKPDGMHNDGLNIAASKGAAVVAADNGIVAYAGNELRGFGNLLLIRHADGWITAYAHLDKIEVERGAKVKRGQTIGRVGQTGSVTSPQLHFELRKGSQAVDPRDQLDKRSS